MKIIFHSHANKTHFHKGLALRLVLKLRGFGTRKGPMKWPIQLPVCPAEWQKWDHQSPRKRHQVR